MDTGKGYFETAETEELLRKKMEDLHAMKIENQPPIFRVGEEIELRGSHMRITKIGKHFMTLKLLPTRGECALPPEARAAKGAP